MLVHLRRMLIGVVLLVALTVPAVAAEPQQDAAESARLAKVADHVAKEVESLRGWKFKKPVDKRFASPADVRAYLNKQVAEHCSPAQEKATETFLQMVGLLPPDSHLKDTLLDLMEEQVGGYYEPKDGALYLVNRGKPLPALVERVMLAHELTHALDDQYVDLRAFMDKMAGKTEDLDLTGMSVTEGSATALMMRYMVRAQMSGEFDAAELQEYGAEEMQRSQALIKAPRYFTVLLGAYICGTEFLARGNLLTAMMGKRGMVGKNLQAAVKDPPQSTEQILHPEKYWDAAMRDDPVLVDDDAVKRLIEEDGRRVVHTNTVGEMLCAILTNPPGVRRSLMSMQTSSAWTNDGAAGWGGDRFYLLASGRDAKAAASNLRQPRGVWVTLWDSEGDRDEFLGTYGRHAPNGSRLLAPFGTLGVVALFGFDEAQSRAMAERFKASPPAMTRAGKPWTPWAL